MKIKLCPHCKKKNGFFKTMHIANVSPYKHEAVYSCSERDLYFVKRELLIFKTKTKYLLYKLKE